MEAKSKTEKFDHTQSPKLWKYENRMFMERILYLNNTTTKYIIVGIHPVNFEHRVRICDRTTGCHISVEKENFNAFLHVVKSVIEKTYKLVRGIITSPDPVCGVKFHCYTSEIWKLSLVNKPYTSVFVDISGFKTLLRIEPIILKLLGETEDGKLCCETIKEIAEATFDMTEDESMAYLKTRLEQLDPQCIEFMVIADLITNKDSYINISSFRDIYNCTVPK